MTETTPERPRRITPLALLLVQLLVAVLAPIADARGDREIGDAVVHVESDDRPPCPTGHNHLQCQLCRHIGSNLLAAASIERVPQRGAVHVSDQRQSEVAPRTVRLGVPLGSRAPPIV